MPGPVVDLQLIPTPRKVSDIFRWGQENFRKLQDAYTSLLTYLVDAEADPLHNHDGDYSSSGHNHNTEYSGITHGHESDYGHRGVHVYRTTSAQSIPISTPTALLFNAETYDDDGWHDNSTNPSRLTVPAAHDGKRVKVTGQISLDSVTPNKEVRIVIYLNGSATYFIVDSQTGGDGFPVAQVSGIFDSVSTGDYFEITVEHDDTGARDAVVNENRAWLEVLG